MNLTRVKSSSAGGMSGTSTSSLQAGGRSTTQTRYGFRVHCALFGPDIVVYFGLILVYSAQEYGDYTIHGGEVYDRNGKIGADL